LNFNGQDRPDFAIKPGPGQESVWDYPRPPVVKPCGKLVEVKLGDILLARSSRSYRLLETASPPTFYLPHNDVTWDQLVKVPGSSVCEWKGAAQYWGVVVDADTPVAWSYPRPRARYAALKDYVSFYPGRVQCFVAGESVLPQPGRFYGGWITADVVGPFKGDPGTGHW
jgi:uncharacterized protein (DUF427 family)